MRITFSRSNTKILPSPILPVFADFSIASIACSSNSLLIAASTFTFGRKSTTYSAPRYSSVWPFCRPNPFTSVTVMPCTPIADSASRTSSSLNGLMIAVTSFIGSLLERLAQRQDERVAAGVACRSSGAVREAVELALRAVALRARADVSGAEDPAGSHHVVRAADLPVGVVRVVHVLEVQVSNVSVHAEAA